MSCISPPELTELHLAMFLDGDADERVAAHLLTCPHCRDRARSLALAQNHLKTQLYRLSCPVSDDLRDYHYGLLDPARVVEVSRHLAQCPHCTQELFVDYGSGRVTPVVALAGPDLVERIKLLVANLVDMGAGSLTPALSMRQGGLASDEGQTQIYVAGDIQISLEIEASPEQPDHRMLAGLLSGIEIDRMQVHLWQADRLIMTAPVDRTGSFELSLATLSSGKYGLYFNGPELKIHVPSVQIG